MEGDQRARQSVADVIGSLIGGCIVFVAGWFVVGLFGNPAWPLRAAVAEGLAFGLASFAIAYRRRPGPKRLAPLAAVRTGVAGIALMVGVIELLLPRQSLPWMLAVVVVLMLAPAYLLVSGYVADRRGSTVSGGAMGGI